MLSPGTKTFYCIDSDQPDEVKRKFERENFVARSSHSLITTGYLGTVRPLFGGIVNPCPQVFSLGIALNCGSLNSCLEICSPWLTPIAAG